jgi:hypothetical protein
MVTLENAMTSAHCRFRDLLMANIETSEATGLNAKG